MGEGGRLTILSANQGSLEAARGCGTQLVITEKQASPIEDKEASGGAGREDMNLPGS